MTPGRGQFGHQGLDWQDLCIGPLNIPTNQIYKLWTSWFQRRTFFYKSKGVHYPLGSGHFGPRILIGMIYVGDH